MVCVDWLHRQVADKNANDAMSPLSATTEVPTEYLLNYLSSYEKDGYLIGKLLRSRPTTTLYQIDAAFRGDPYPGALAAIDYLRCREGKTFEERKSNLVMCWGEVVIDHQNKTFSIKSEKVGVNDFVDDVRKSNRHNLLTKTFGEMKNYEIPRYYMQVRYGSMFSKSKHIRVYSYFADAILFKDGAVWRDA